MNPLGYKNWEIPVRLPNGGDSVAADKRDPSLDARGTSAVKLKTDHTVLLLCIGCIEIEWVKVITNSREKAHFTFRSIDGATAFSGASPWSVIRYLEPMALPRTCTEIGKELNQVI